MNSQKYNSEKTPLTKIDSFAMGMIRTKYAAERTFLSLLRTCAIFIGISLLLIQQRYFRKSAIFIIIASLITVPISAFFYIKQDAVFDLPRNSQYSKYYTRILGRKSFERYIPVFYGLIIMLIMSVQLYVYLNHKNFTIPKLNASNSVILTGSPD